MSADPKNSGIHRDFRVQCQPLDLSKRNGAAPMQAKPHRKNGGIASLGQAPSVPNDQEDGGQPDLNSPGPGDQGARSSEQKPPRTEPVANKKQILLSLVDGSGDARGHRFATTRATSNNLQIKCEDCGLWIQQIDSKSVFNRKVVANYCKWGTRFSWKSFQGARACPSLE